MSTLAEKKPTDVNAYPWWSPRFWHALRVTDWLALLGRGRLRLNPVRWPMAFMISLTAPFNSVMGGLQRLWYGRLIDATRVDPPPVFIVGHWRSGTTLLHELMSLDTRFATPNTYQCMAPHHCLLTEGIISSYGKWLLPKQRPMDNMAAGWDRPQEDEFALLALGAPTPYFRMAFPNDPPVYDEFLDMDGCSPRDLVRFEQALVGFAKLITFKTGKQLLFKSPPHTGRIGHLAQWFPGAKFIHISRHPDSLYPSTVRLWKSLDDVQGLQLPHNKNVREYVFHCLERMYHGYAKQRAELPADALYEISYEALVKDPVGAVGRIYEQLKLGDYSAVGPAIGNYMQSQKDFKTNRHELDPETKAAIRSRWADYFTRFGYDPA